MRVNRGSVYRIKWDVVAMDTRALVIGLAELTISDP